MFTDVLQSLTLLNFTVFSWAACPWTWRHYSPSECQASRQQ